jgi:electron transport complex protein RnfG
VNDTRDTTTNSGATPPPMPPPEAGAGSARMILTMGMIGLVCGFLIVVTFQVTLPVIDRNKAAALERAIFEVVPGAAEKTTFEKIDGRLVRVDGAPRSYELYHACYDSVGTFVGVALEASGQGFQDIIRVLYGYSPGKGAIIGMKVLESRETPGLGDKIETDAAFRANFEALDVALDDSQSNLRRAIELVKPGKKTDDWQIEAITGATISSRAIASILQESAKVQVPIIVHDIESLSIHRDDPPEETPSPKETPSND